MFTQQFIKTVHSVQEIGSFLLFQNLALGKASTDDNCHFQFLELDLVSINVSAKFYQNIPNILGPTKNVISQSLGLDLVNINVYPKVYQNIPLSLRLFSLFQNLNLGQSQMTFDNLLGYILSISMLMQNFIKIFQTV